MAIADLAADAAPSPSISELDVAIEVVSDPDPPPVPRPAARDRGGRRRALAERDAREGGHRPPAPRSTSRWIRRPRARRDAGDAGGRALPGAEGSELARPETPVSESRVLLAPIVRTTDPDEETTLINAARAETIAEVAAKMAAAQASAVEVQHGPEMDADEEQRLLAELAELEGLEEGSIDVDGAQAREFDDEIDTGVYEPSAVDVKPAPPPQPASPVFPPPGDATAAAGHLPPSRPPSLPPPTYGSAAPPPLHRALDGERPAPLWLDGAAKAAMEARATWLEEEARASRDRVAAARGLLLVSELRAILGDAEGAERLANGAKTAWPQLALPHRQVRGLSTTGEPKVILEQHDAAVRSAVTSEAKLHELLMAAEAARVRGAPEDVVRKRWEQAWRAGPNDPRVVVGRAALAVARKEATSAALRVPEGEEFAPLVEAVVSAMRMRDMPAATATSGAKEPTETLRRARQALAANKTAAAAKLIADLREVPELAGGAAWLGAALSAATRETRAEAMETLARLHEPAAVRLRAALGLELGDDATVAAALLETRAFSVEERLSLHLLLGAPDEMVLGELRALEDEGSALASAAAAMARGEDTRTAGLERSRRAVLLGRRLARKATADKLEEVTLARAEDEPEETRALKLEVAFRAARWDALADDLRAWEGGSEGGARAGDRFLASALVGERTGDAARAVDGPSCRAKLESNRAPRRGARSVGRARAPPARDGGRSDRTARGWWRGGGGGPRRSAGDAKTARSRAPAAAPELRSQPFLAERIASRTAPSSTCAGCASAARGQRSARGRASTRPRGVCSLLPTAIRLRAERSREAHRARRRRRTVSLRSACRGAAEGRRRGARSAPRRPPALPKRDAPRGRARVRAQRRPRGRPPDRPRRTRRGRRRSRAADAALARRPRARGDPRRRRVSPLGRAPVDREDRRRSDPAARSVRAARRSRRERPRRSRQRAPLAQVHPGGLARSPAEPPLRRASAPVLGARRRARAVRRVDRHGPRGRARRRTGGARRALRAASHAPRRLGPDRGALGARHEAGAPSPLGDPPRQLPRARGLELARRARVDARAPPARARPPRSPRSSCAPAMSRRCSAASTRRRSCSSARRPRTRRTSSPGSGSRRCGSPRATPRARRTHTNPWRARAS